MRGVRKVLLLMFPVSGAGPMALLQGHACMPVCVYVFVHVSMPHWFLVSAWLGLFGTALDR
jgi:hypothetical protein